MIRSMTGFGRAAFEVAGIAFELEVRSVNHRHFDFRARLPRQFALWEQELRAQAQQTFARGKVDLSIAISGLMRELSSRVHIDLALVQQYLAAAEAIQKENRLESGLDAAKLLTLPGVIRLEETEFAEEIVRDALFAAAKQAFDAADLMRGAEGTNLEAELSARLKGFAEQLASIEQRSSLVQEAARERLRKRAEQLRDETGILDEARLHQEIVFWADRLDLTEESVRLRSHIDQFHKMLQAADRAQPVGRKLDFLIQEMGREVNTIGSKANDGPIAHTVVELKTELERIREQVQNIE